ncbi:MAG: DUF1761 domain-containing protein [Hyphomicrobiales bacterium]|nr:DUF1761 domain-containing protein [Hyphomicrobiales bacterium]
MPAKFLAIIAAAVAAWIFGAIYYGVFGKTWMRALGWSPTDMTRPDGKRATPVLPLIVSFVAELVMAWVLASTIRHVYGAGDILMAPALKMATTLWAGFVLPTVATNYAFQKRRDLVFAIDIVHWLGVMLIEGAVLALML